MFFRRVFEAVFMVTVPCFKFSFYESYVAERLVRGGNYCFVYDALFQAVTVQRAVVFLSAAASSFRFCGGGGGIA